MPTPSPTAASRRLKLLLDAARARPALATRLKLDRRLPWHAELKLVSGPAMRRLNHQYRGKDYATDVLSFPAPRPFLAQGVLGELVICLPVLRRQARGLGHSPAAELEVLLAHGILHLLGWDHEKSPREAAAMARWEKRLLPARRTGLVARGERV